MNTCHPRPMTYNSSAVTSLRSHKLRSDKGEVNHLAGEKSDGRQSRQTNNLGS